MWQVRRQLRPIRLSVSPAEAVALQVPRVAREGGEPRPQDRSRRRARARALVAARALASRRHPRRLFQGCGSAQL